MHGRSDKYFFKEDREEYVSRGVTERRLEMKKLMNVCNKVCYLVGCLSISVICCAVVAQVFNRFVLNGAFKWTDEISQMMLIVMVFSGMGLVEQNNEQIRMEMIYKIFPKWRFGIDLVLKIITAFFTLVLLYSEKLLFPSIRGVVAKASQIPIIFVHVVMIAGLVFWLLSIILGIIEMLMNKHKNAGGLA